MDELENAVIKGLRIAETQGLGISLSQADPETDEKRRIIGHTPAMRELFKMIGLLSRNRATILIVGETGSGKELIARVIHDSSIFRDQRYITVDLSTRLIIFLSPSCSVMSVSVHRRC